jgi:ketosteroid isomerase-like protein
MFEQRTQRSMEAMGRKDVAAVMRSWADDSVLEFMGHTPLSGRYEGKPAIEGFFRQVFDGVDKLRITVRHVAFANPIGLTYNNTVYVEYVVDETSRGGMTIHDERIAVFEYRRGKVVSMREWAFDPTIVESMWGQAAGRA